MGMFDRVLPGTKLILSRCPICNHKFTKEEDWDWQTKSYKNLCLNVSLRTLRQSLSRFEIHNICGKCGNLLQINFSDSEITVQYRCNKEKEKKIIKKLSKSALKNYKILTDGKESFMNYTYNEDDYL